MSNYTKEYWKKKLVRKSRVVEMESFRKFLNRKEKKKKTEPNLIDNCQLIRFIFYF